MRDFKKAALKSLSVKIENPLFHAFTVPVNFCGETGCNAENSSITSQLMALFSLQSSQTMTEIAPKHIFFSIMLCCMMMIATGNDQ